MFSARFRLVLMGLFLVLAGLLMYQKQFPYGIGLLMGFALLVWGYFRNGSVYLAYRNLRRERYERAEKLLSEISRPQWLGRIVKAYYYMSLGHLSFHHGEYEQAQTHFETAHSMRPPNGNDRAIILLNLAQLANIGGDRAQARKYLNEAENERMNSELAESLEAYRRKLS